MMICLLDAMSSGTGAKSCMVMKLNHHSSCTRMGWRRKWDQLQRKSSKQLWQAPRKGVGGLRPPSRLPGVLPGRAETRGGRGDSTQDAVSTSRPWAALHSEGLPDSHAGTRAGSSRSVRGRFRGPPSGRLCLPPPTARCLCRGDIGGDSNTDGF